MGKLISYASRGSPFSRLAWIIQHATADLVQLDGFEQCLEVALPKALVPLALDDLEEDGGR